MRGVEPAPDLSHQRPAVATIPALLRLWAPPVVVAASRRADPPSLVVVLVARAGRLVVGADRGDASLEVTAAQRGVERVDDGGGRPHVLRREARGFRSGDGTRASRPGLARPGPARPGPDRSPARPSPASRRWRRPPPRSRADPRPPRRRRRAPSTRRGAPRRIAPNRRSSEARARPRPSTAFVTRRAKLVTLGTVLDGLDARRSRAGVALADADTRTAPPNVARLYRGGHARTSVARSRARDG